MESKTVAAVERLLQIQRGIIEPGGGKRRNLADVYMAILWLIAVGQPEAYSLMR